MAAPPPFDPGALLAMLQANYPIVGPLYLARALGERPDYFGGGVITRPNGDKIQLPDGRMYDCIVNSGGRPGTTFWSCSLVDPNGPPVDDPFALEQGPLAFVDEQMEIFPGDEPSFETLVAGGLEPLNGSDEVLGAGRDAIVTADIGGAIDNDGGELLDPAQEAHEEIRVAFNDDDPSDVIATTDSHGSEIASGQADYVEDPVPPQPVPDPGDPPETPPKPPPPDI